MVQPRLTNRQENRIIVRNGKAEYSVPITVGVRLLTYFLYFPPNIIYNCLAGIREENAFNSELLVTDSSSLNKQLHFWAQNVLGQ